MDYSRKQLPPAQHPVKRPRQSAEELIIEERIARWLLRLCVSGVIGVLLSEILLRLMGIRTPQSIFVISHLASFWSDVVSLPWGYWFTVLLHLFDYSLIGIFLVIGAVGLKRLSLQIDNGWAILFGIVSSVVVLLYACKDENAGLTELLGGPFVLLVIAFGFEVLWLNPMLVDQEPVLQGNMKPNLWVYVVLLEGLLVFQKIGSHDDIFNDQWNLGDWWLLAEWIFWLAVAALACLQAVMCWKLGVELWDDFKNSKVYDAIRRFLIWVSRPWIALPVKYPPFKPPDYFGTGGRLSADPSNDEVMATGLVNDDDPENARSVVYDKRKTTVVDERETLRLK